MGKATGTESGGSTGEQGARDGAELRGGAIQVAHRSDIKGTTAEEGFGTASNSWAAGVPRGATATYDGRAGNNGRSEEGLPEASPTGVRGKAYHLRS